MSIVPDDEQLVAAIYDGSLFKIARPGSPAQLACSSIEDQVSSAATALIDAMASADIRARRIGETQLFHHFDLELAPKDVPQAFEVTKTLGYRRWAALEGGALRCYLEYNRSMMFIRDGESGMRAVLRWGPRRRVPRRFRPSIKSLSSLRLPDAMWPIYFAFHPLHGLASRLNGTRHTPEPRPFLGTPSSLILPLFAAARLGSDDLFIDLGCGDGRVAIEAAMQFGCRAIGIEYHASIAEIARRRAAESGVGDLVTIIHGDVMDADLDQATVIFAFLPMPDLRALLPRILSLGKSGARVIAHEVSPLDPDFAPRPAQSLPVIGRDAVSVAHVWIVGKGQ